LVSKMQAQNGEDVESSREHGKNFEKAALVCPRCGLPVSWFEKLRRGDRVYVRAVHFLGYVGKKKVVRKCYLGPVESYEYVSHLHRKEGLEFYGLHYTTRIFEYLDRLLDVLFDVENLEGVDVNKLIEKMRKVIEFLEKIEKQKQFESRQ